MLSRLSKLSKPLFSNQFNSSLSKCVFPVISTPTRLFSSAHSEPLINPEHFKNQSYSRHPDEGVQQTTYFLGISSTLLAVSAMAWVINTSMQYKDSPPSNLASKVPPEGLPGTNLERTFIAIKPDGVQRQLIGKIIQRFEEKGFTLVALKLITPTAELAAGHYDDLKSKPFFPGLVRFFSAGPIVAMVWEGKGVIKTGRVMLGETDPAKSLPGTVRGDYSIDIGRNIIHGSDSAEAAKHEINYWFADNEVFDWESSMKGWIYEKK